MPNIIKHPKSLVDTQSDLQQEPRQYWADEEHIVPENPLLIVFAGLMLTTFLTALDQTMLAIALPTIIADLNGFSKYSWVGAAYLFVTAAFSPLYGRLSDVVGRKPVLLGSIGVFLLGSILCGAAQNLTWLICCRALQGLGGGGILQLVQIVIADITTLEERGKYAATVGVTSGIAAIVGPLVGGALIDRVSWRWTFILHIPIGGCGAAILFFFLKLNPPPKKPISEHLASFDFLGLLIIMSAVGFILIGFDFAETNWASPTTISCLSVGVALLGLMIWAEGTTSRNPIIPPRLFKNRTTALVLLSVFLHATVFFATSFYLPLYYQSLGASAMLAGLKMLTYNLGTSLFSALWGLVLSKLGDYRQILWVGWGFQALGYGLMIQLNEYSSTATQEIFTLIAALGTGGLFIPPLMALHAAMPISDMATSTSTYILVRSLGSTIGVSIGHTIFASRLVRYFQLITDLFFVFD
ncbi:hypothetical protein CROQUDRAFT_52526 [Cronartium quercuum f. sp. fusiforme G11]|uniref:Major facilitator superfamily (MFS) profile domain-containing protein n=1 Tax=Cronartium quercuum f. sp. fusiforme G11 TaxID=708437 RepID=A0A9P6N7T8_9BASI|nr:hypothetical protein CROQUDRAFT_52526 [Cronartium quercuum f. sp. fusiforme G11]